MKKLFFVAVSLASAVLLKAQSTEFGIKGGLNIANLSEKDANYNSRTSFNAGILVHSHISKYFAIQPELEYSRQGASFTDAQGQENINLAYVNLPVLVQYMAGAGFRLETGPQIGLLVSAHTNVNGAKSSVMNDFNKPDFSWAFGAGYLSPVGLGIDARYNLGISNINASTPPTIRNSVFAVGLFYQFGKIK